MGDYSELSVDDLKAMILGLKMASFSYINDEDLLTSITCLISDLPTPESLTCDNCDIKSVTERMGYIMSLIEKGGCKNKASEARHESKTGMPPRYCLVNSNKDNKMKKEAADKLVAELLEISNIADSEELYDVSDNALSIAESIVEGKNVSADSVDKLIKQCESNSKLVKLADWKRWIQDNRLNPFPPGQRDARQNYQTQVKTRNRLQNIIDLSKSDYYDTGKISEIINAIPDPATKAKFDRYITNIGNVEQQFAEWVNDMVEDANKIVQNQPTDQLLQGLETAQKTTEDQAKQSMREIGSDIPGQKEKDARKAFAKDELGIRQEIIDRSGEIINSNQAWANWLQNYIEGRDLTEEFNQFVTDKLASRQKWIKIN